MDSPSPCYLLTLSDELILLIVNQLDRHEDVPNFWMTCKKLKGMSTEYMYRNTVVRLPEEEPRNELIKLIFVPNNIKQIRHLTFLNEPRVLGGFYYPDIVAQPHSVRIQRWGIMERGADALNSRFGQSAFLIGSRFNWSVRLTKGQLTSFRWRHALPLSLQNLGAILSKQAGSLAALELSMIQPPPANSVRELEATIKKKEFPKLLSLTYNGLSHTEPIPQNRPEKGGRFRMLRPIFRKAYRTLEELTLSQDHCVSQIGKTPLINGRTFDAFLCELDELYINPKRSDTTTLGSVKLDLSKLELGGFKVANLFDIPSLPTMSPRVRIELSSLRRLVLNECDGLGRLLQDIQGRDELNLTEFGLRIVEDQNAFEDFNQLADTVKGFLTSFRGLRILSILWDGANAPEAEAISAAMTHHFRTVEVYVFAAREDANDEDEHLGTTLRFVSIPQASSPWTPVFKTNRPSLRELGLNVSQTNFECLRLLSRFELRTVHIRNFPLLADGFWRDEEGTITHDAREKAATWAEYIALPFYALSKGLREDAVDNGADMAVAEKFKLQDLADIHVSNRDERLGCVKLKTIYSSSAPTRDLSKRILDQRADIDFHFAALQDKIRKKQATDDEQAYYDEYLHRVQSVLGIAPPSELDKPKLRLLIIGDWRYRDQLNLAGPRNWDPRAWSIEHGDDLNAGMNEDEMDDDEDIMPGVDSHAGVQYRLRPGFKKEWDVSLLPIFFKVDWVAEEDPKDGKWRWKAVVEGLDRSTLEGYGALGDVKGLDFAFVN